MTTIRDRFRDYRWRRENEKARSLASQRDDLIAAGVDPNELLVPVAPIRPRPQTTAATWGREDIPIDSASRAVPSDVSILADRDDWENGPSEQDWVITPFITPAGAPRVTPLSEQDCAKHLRELARVWAVVAAALLAAFAGTVSAAGAILVVQDDLTAYGIVAMAIAVVYLCGVGGAAGHARNLYRRAREHDGGDDD